MLTISVTAAATFLVTLVGVWQFRAFALSRSILDHPNERSSHTTPTPRGGGVIAAITILIAFCSGSYFLGVNVPVWYVIAVALVIIVGWLDDVHSLSFLIRLAVHLGAAALVMIAYGAMPVLSFPGEVSLTIGAASLILGGLWIVWMTNAYNFMDGIDGIAGLQAIVAGIGWFAYGMLSGNRPNAMVFGATIAAASAAFLLFNWQPAKIFMGDAGSSFLGFCLSSFPFVIHKGEPIADTRALIFSIVIVWPFVFDSVFTITRRLVRGERVWQAHREHLYQRLVIGGRPHWAMATLYGAIAALAGTATLFALFGGLSYGALIVFGVLLITFLAVLLLSVKYGERKL